MFVLVKSGLLLTLFFDFVCGAENVHGPYMGITSYTSWPGTHSRSNEHGLASWNYDSEISRVLESHWLRMLNLSSRPRDDVMESVVPCYMRALQHAGETRLSSSTNSNQLMWAVKATQVNSASQVLTSSFNIVGKSRDISPWRVELVLEATSARAGSRRGRAIVDVCHSTSVGENSASCVLSQLVHRRQYSGLSRHYTVHNVTSSFSSVWSYCHSKSCQVDVRVRELDSTDIENPLVILVVYENTLPDVRATRRALRSVSEQPTQPQGQHNTAEERYRRDVAGETSYCQPYKWTVYFHRDLNWTWVVAPSKFEAGYCAGRCPRQGTDLDQVNLTNHAFMRMAYRTRHLHADYGHLPLPVCVPVQYRPLSILYQTNGRTFELRHVNDMVTTACGCL